MNSDGSSQIRLTTDAFIDNNPSFSPNGSFIVFESNRLGQYEIYVMRSNGGEPSRVTYSTQTDTIACFNPDSTRLAFTSTRGGGDNEICITGVGGERVVPVLQLTSNSYTDYQPSWALGSVPAPPITAPITTRAVKTSTALSSFEVVGNTLHLSFTSALSNGAASAFSVNVDGEVVAVSNATVTGDSVTLQLPNGALQPGAIVSVSWHALKDVQNGTIADGAGTTTAH